MDRVVGIDIDKDRGCALHELTLGGVQVLYSDRSRKELGLSQRSTFWMVPNSGTIPVDVQRYLGIDLPPHGYGRAMKWNYERGGESGSESDGHCFSLVTDQINATQSIAVQGTTATFSLEICNRSDETMFINPGHHAYYKVDLTRKTETHFTDGITLTHEQYDIRFNGSDTVMIKNPGTFHCELPGVGTLRRDVPPTFKRIRLWSEPGKGFVCVEPVVGRPECIESEGENLAGGAKRQAEYTVTRCM